MQKKLTLHLFGLMAVLLFTAGNLMAQTITFVTPEGGDEYQITFLEKQGFTVNQFYAPGGIINWGPDTITMLNNSELIICGRSLESSEFFGVDKRTAWNSLAAPLIFNGIHGANPIGWFKTTSERAAATDLSAEILTPGDSILDFAPDISGNTMDWLYSGTDYLLTNDTTNNNGTFVLASADKAPYNAYLVRFEPGVPFYEGSTDTAKGPRTYIPFGGGVTTFPLTKNAQAVYYAEILRLLGKSISAPVYMGVDNSLSSLTVDKGSLSPAFSPDIFTYDLALDANEDTLLVTATANESTSNVVDTGTYVITKKVTLFIKCFSEIGTKATYKINVTLPVGVDEVSGDSDPVKIYPNPCSDMITISASAHINLIEITDLQGKVVYHINVNDTKAELNLDDLNTGVYFIRTQTSEVNYINRIIKN